MEQPQAVLCGNKLSRLHQPKPSGRCQQRILCRRIRFLHSREVEAQKGTTLGANLQPSFLFCGNAHLQAQQFNAKITAWGWKKGHTWPSKQVLAMLCSLPASLAFEAASLAEAVVGNARLQHTPACHHNMLLLTGLPKIMYPCWLLPTVLLNLIPQPFQTSLPFSCLLSALAVVLWALSPHTPCVASSRRPHLQPTPKPPEEGTYPFFLCTIFYSFFPLHFDPNQN